MTQSIKRRGSPRLTINNNQYYSAGGVFPFIFTAKIDKKTIAPLAVGDLYLALEKNKIFEGSIFIQAQAKMHPAQYSDLKIFLDVILYPANDYIIQNSEFVITNTMPIEDFIKVDLNIPAQKIAENEKIGLIIKAQNIGPGTGQYNIINLIYFQKKG